MMLIMYKPLLTFLLIFCAVEGQLASFSAPIKGNESVIQISVPPPIKPETLPIKANPGDGSSYSIDNPANVKDYMQYEAYNTFPREIDLWNLEGKRLIRGLSVISPDRTAFVYSEVMFIPNNRQTFSKLYWVPVQPLPAPPQTHLPSEDAHTSPPLPLPPSAYAARLDPDKTIKLRKSLVGVGYEKVKPFDFRTLTVVDWSASGDRLLFKERAGVLHVGVRTTNILIYDQGQGTVTIYPEVQRIIRNYWVSHGNLPHLDKISWDIQPLGWEPHSDSDVLIKAWAYDKNEKKFLGLWRYDVDSEHTQLVTLEDLALPVAANGWLASPIPIPPEPHGRDAWKANLRHPFKLQRPVAPPPSEPLTPHPP
jgi:hypothetical protein